MTRALRPVLPLLMAALAAGVMGGGADADRRLVNDHCPVMVDEFSSPAHEVEFQGVAVRFCCSDCKETFAGDPSPYLSRLPQLAGVSLSAVAAEPSPDAGAERMLAWIDRWGGPVLLLMACVALAMLVLRIVRRAHRAHAATGAFPSSDADEVPHPAGGPRLHD